MKQFIRLVTIVGIVAIAAFMIIFALNYLNNQSVKPYGKAEPQTSGYKIPKGYDVYGIDVSRHQGKIDWNKVANMITGGKKLTFVFIKATEGVTWNDYYFKRNWAEAKKAGLKRGAYHFFHPYVSASAQANHFIRHVKLEKGDLPPVVDFEKTNNKPGKEIIRKLKEFLTLLEKEYKVKPVIYTRPELYKKYLKDNFGDYPIWISSFQDYEIFRWRFANKWTFWQFTEHAMIDGIKGRVDMNVFRGDAAEFQEMLIR